MPRAVTNIDLNSLKVVNLGAPIASTDMANKVYVDERVTPIATAKGTAAQNNTTVTPTAITGLSFSVFPGFMFHFKYMGTFQSSNTAGGLLMGFVSAPSTTYCSWTVRLSSAAATAGTDYYHLASATALGTTIGSAGVAASGTNYHWEVEGFVQTNTLGSLTLGFATSSAGRTATNNAGCMGMLTFVR